MSIERYERAMRQLSMYQSIEISEKQLEKCSGKRCQGCAVRDEGEIWFIGWLLQSMQMNYPIKIGE